jgi:hypothetical protein
MSLVLDSSATLAWIYGDETTAAIRALFDQLVDAGAVVPDLWRLEGCQQPDCRSSAKPHRSGVPPRRSPLALVTH